MSLSNVKNKTIKLSTNGIGIGTRCKKGTMKYKPLGDGCYTDEEIHNFKAKKTKKTKEPPNDKIPNDKIGKKKTKKQLIDFEIVGAEPELITTVIAQPKKQKKVSIKRRLKIPVELIEEMPPPTKATATATSKRYNEEFIELMDKLSEIMLKQGEPFRARAYQKAQETIMVYPDDIVEPKQLVGLPGIGSTIMEKLNEYVETGTLRILEREKTNPINILADVYGIGPKKANDLVKANIVTIDELRSKQNEVLNEVQKTGLKYYEQLQERIPRSEIQEYETIFEDVFSRIASNDHSAKMEIVGSYRRGAQTSGDIDVIITGDTRTVYTNFVDELLKTGIILEILSRGQSKTLVIAKLPNKQIARRVDFLYAPPNEFPFAILYFTGSKIFNTVMRQYALNKGYTFNEHGIYSLENKKKGAPIVHDFRTEKDIFDFLGLEYKAPVDRKDGRAVRGTGVTDATGLKSTSVTDVTGLKDTSVTKKNKTVKKREPIDDLNIIAIVEDFKKNGITVLQDLSEHQLVQLIKLTSAKYYNDEPILTDNQYDIIKDFTNDKFPHNAAYNEVGADVLKNKVKLPYEMASMDKIKPDTGALEEWKRKYSGPYVISCKLDGVSGMYTTEGTKPKLYTRGNGKVGQDVSHLVPFLRLPKTKGLVIRGEFIIPKAVFADKYKTKFANARNMVAGIVNQKTVSDAVVDLHFVAYEVIVPQKKPSEQMSMLSTLNVETVLNQTMDNITNDILSGLLVDWRQVYMYEIDGIIVTDDKVYPRKSGNPQHSFAFKMVLSDQVAEARVVDVLWTPSKDGYLKPRVQIEKINLGGVTIEYATGFNAAFIQDNNVGVGATIELIRSGDVIPHIKAVTVPAPLPKMPSVPFKWNDTHVDVMLENAAADPTVKEKNITGFFRGIGVEGLSSGNVARLIGAGYDTVPKIIKMPEQEFLKVEGFKGKMANKLYTGIQDKLREASIITLMAASNIFGRGFSDKKVELIMNEMPDILVSKQLTQDKIRRVSEIKGMALKTAEAFVNKIDDFVSFIKECGLESKLTQPVVPIQAIADMSHPLFGKTVVLTGTRDKGVLDLLKNVGANLGTSVSKSTFVVVAKNKDDDTGKAEEARKLNVPIMSVEEFVSNYAI